MPQQCSILLGIMVGVVLYITTLGTTHGVVIQAIRGMIGIGISAMAEVGVSTFGGAGEVTTIHGVHIIITTILDMVLFGVAAGGITEVTVRVMKHLA